MLSDMVNETKNETKETSKHEWHESLHYGTFVIIFDLWILN